MPPPGGGPKAAAAKTGARTIARASESAAASGMPTIAKAATPAPNASATSAPTETGRARVDGLSAGRLADRERRVDDRVVEVVTAGPVERPRARDEPQGGQPG